MFTQKNLKTENLHNLSMRGRLAVCVDKLQILFMAFWLVTFFLPREQPLCCRRSRPLIMSHVPAKESTIVSICCQSGRRLHARCPALNRMKRICRLCIPQFPSAVVAVVALYRTFSRVERVCFALVGLVGSNCDTRPNNFRSQRNVRVVFHSVSCLCLRSVLVLCASAPL